MEAPPSTMALPESLKETDPSKKTSVPGQKWMTLYLVDCMKTQGRHLKGVKGHSAHQAPPSTMAPPESPKETDPSRKTRVPGQTKWMTLYLVDCMKTQGRHLTGVKGHSKHQDKHSDRPAKKKHDPTSNQRTKQRASFRKPRRCVHCRKTFPTPSALLSHIVIHSEEKPYKCLECDGTFKRPHDLKVHRRTHTGEKPYGCDACGKTFTMPHHLTVHRRTHTGEKPYQCQCGKTYGSAESLKTHQLSHTGEKPYDCSMCGKSFSDRSNLNKHLRIHKGEKPYICDECGKCFALGQHLRSHQRTHTGEKAPRKQPLPMEGEGSSTSPKVKVYRCVDCGKTCSERGNLKIHMRKHTGERPYCCQQCGLRFKMPHHLKRHQQLH